MEFPMAFLQLTCLLMFITVSCALVRDNNHLELNRSSFPEGFIFGTASSSYQYEGAASEAGRGPSIWDTFTHEHPERIADGSNGDVAVDSYHRYKGDVNIMKDMGLDAYRFSISWSRILPNGRLSGGINREGINHYNKFIDELISNGLQPFATLFHFDMPQGLEDKYGGFLSPNIVEDFRDYAGICFSEFGDRVKHWITFNEISSFSVGGFSVGGYAAVQSSPLGFMEFKAGDSGREPYIVGHNQLLAHAAAVKLYRDRFKHNKDYRHRMRRIVQARNLHLIVDLKGNTTKQNVCPKNIITQLQECLCIINGYTGHETFCHKLVRICRMKDPTQKGKIGISLGTNWMVPYSNTNSNIDAVERTLDFTYGWVMDPLTRGNYPFNMRRLIGSRLPKFTEEQSKMLRGSFNFIGVNYYTASYIYSLPAYNGTNKTYFTDMCINQTALRDGIPIGPLVGSSWIYNYPKGIRDLLLYTKGKYNNPVIYITENGVDEVNNRTLSLEESLEDDMRIDYHNQHLYHVQSAISNGLASVLYVGENTTLEHLRNTASDKLQIPIGSFTLSYSMKQYGNASVRIVTNDDLRLMVAIHRQANEAVIKMEASTTTICNSSTTVQGSNEIDKSQSTKSSQAMVPVREDEILMDTVRIPLSWHESITGVGQTFENVKSLRMALTNYAIAKHFGYKFVKNDLQRLTVECAKKESMNCKWRLHASPIKQGPIWSIKKFNELHACGGGIPSSGNPHASRKWASSLFQSILKQRPNYRPVDAVKDIREQYGIKMPYNTIWNGRELARGQLYGEGKRSYDMLRWYEGKVKETNPGSFVTIHKGDDGRFIRMFICYQPCYEGFIDGCRPLLFLDGTFIKDRSKGILLAATGYDADNGLFPLAFCICNSEDTSNWCWFLSHLSRVLYQGPRTYEPLHDLVFVSDSDKGLKEAVRTCFPQALHSFCVLHLAQNYRDNLKKKGFSTSDTQAFGQLMKTAAYRCSFRDFERDMATLKSTSSMAYDTLMTSYPPEKWANSLFTGVRYGHVTSNVAESYNNWIRDARHLPILALVEQIRVKMMTRIHERREKAETWTSPVCPHTEDILQSNNKKSLPFMVEPAGNNVFEVFDARTVSIDVYNRSCTCQEWDVHRIPCKHACAVIRYLKQSVYSFCDVYLMVEAFRRTYRHTLYPIPGYDMPYGSDEPIDILPPATKRRRGRTKTRRINNRDLEVPQRKIACSRCHQIGHNRQTCNAPIQD